MLKNILLLTLACCGPLLGGCAGVIIGGAATAGILASDPRTSGTMMEDQAIEMKANKRIGDDRELDSQTHINITSYNQVVLVSGEAPTETLRRQVIDYVSRVEKVRHVYDEIRIAAPSSAMSRTNDVALTTKVKTKLFTTADIDATHIKVVSEAGSVYLMGIIDSEMGQRAAQAASEVGGVQRVVKLFETPPAGS